MTARAALLVACLALCACAPEPPWAESPLTPEPAPAPAGRPRADGRYVNEALAFSLRLPPGWHLPMETDPDPHFYETRECTERDPIACKALEIQGDDAVYDASPDAELRRLLELGLPAERHDDLVPGAVTLVTPPDGPAEGWTRQYEVFFAEPKRRFLIYTNDLTLEESVLPTLRPTR